LLPIVDVVCFSVKVNQKEEVSKGSTEFPMILKQKHQVASNISQLISAEGGIKAKFQKNVYKEKPALSLASEQKT